MTPAELRELAEQRRAERDRLQAAVDAMDPRRADLGLSVGLAQAVSAAHAQAGRLDQLAAEMDRKQPA